MILSRDQIFALIEKPANEDLILKARKYSDKLNLHVNGKGLDSFFEKIKEYETDNQLALRQKYARSNKYLFTELLRPLDKIFTARGGAKYYSLPDPQERKFRTILSDVRKGISIDKWSQDVWMKKKITDPNGIIFIEISKDGKDCYPTYKSIYSIRDYKFSGSLIEYVIFEPEDEEKKRFRIIDDAFDYIIERDGQKLKIIEKESFQNYFSKVPARMVSSEEDEIKGTKMSFIDSVVQIAEEILVDNSIKIIFKYTHGFPGYWEIERTCPTCKGNKSVDGKTCPSCGGDGIRKGRDISDKIIVTLDEAGHAGAIPPAGYVSTDVATWNKMNEESDFMEKLIHKAMWGTLAMMSEKIYQKATGVISDLQPVYDRLNTVSVEAESMEKFMTDLIGRFYFSKRYKGSTIIYGKRYQIESPDQILQKIRDAKSGNIPEQSIKNMYIEYIQTMYSNDPFEMLKQMRIFKLDPFPIYTAFEIKNLGFSQKDIYWKIYFLQFINNIPQDELVFKDIKILISERDTFINEKIESYANLQTDMQPAGVAS